MPILNDKFRDTLIKLLMGEKCYHSDDSPFFRKGEKVMFRSDEMIIKDTEIIFKWRGEEIYSMSVSKRNPGDTLTILGITMEQEVTIC